MSRWGAVILTVCLTLAQGPGIAVLSNGKWVPDLWMSAVIISALAFEKRTAVFLAAAGGLIQDILTGNFSDSIFPLSGDCPDRFRGGKSEI